MRIRAGDRELAYDDAGAGVPLVLLHGFPHHRRLWSAQLSALGGQCRCIAPDLRGFGETPGDPPFSMDLWADDVALLLDALEIDRAVIGGLSMGGYVTFAFWRRHRDRAQALILTDTRAGPETDEGRAKRRDTIALARRHGAVGVARALLPGMLGVSTRKRRPEITAIVDAMLRAARVESIIGASEALMSRADSRPTLATIDVPTLIVVGEEDTLTPPAEAEAMHAGIEGSRVEIVPGAGHLSSLERPSAFNQVVSEFLVTLTGD